MAHCVATTTTIIIIIFLYPINSILCLKNHKSYINRINTYINVYSEIVYIHTVYNYYNFT